jgi:hypothetical protein
LEFYSPTQYLSADESTVNFKCHVVFKMHNPQKPTKWGLHIYAIADSTNGYVWGLIPYYALTTTESLMHPEQTFTTRIVLELISKVQNITHEKGYHLYTDRLDLAYRRGMQFYCDTCPRKTGLNPNKYFAIYRTVNKYH